MKTRIIVGAILILFLISILVFGGLYMMIVLSLFSLAAVYEVGRAIRNKGYVMFLIPAYLFAGSFSFVYVYLGFGWMCALFMFSFAVTILGYLLSPRYSPDNAIANAFIYAYPLPFLICMMMVYFSFSEELAVTAAVIAYGAPSFCDAFAYFGGTWFGKRKLCPKISPKKTIAGSAAAMIGGIVFGGALLFAQTLWNGVMPLWLILLLCVLCGVFSQVGDLFASSVKRWANVKDFSSIFPGHGGIMDRLDSILMCSAVVVAILTISESLGVL